MASGHNEAGLHREPAGVDKGLLLCTHPSAPGQQGVMESSSMEMLACSTKLSFWNSMPTKGAWPRCMKSVLFLRTRQAHSIRHGWAGGGKE